MVIKGYDNEYLTLEEGRIVRLSGKFEVMDYRKVIKLWLDSGKHLSAYLSNLYSFYLCEYF